MMVLVSYDVSSKDAASAKRLRHLSKACRDYGQRVQYSVFEIEVDPAQWVFLKSKLLSIIVPSMDSLRFYFLGKQWQSKVEHHGAKPTLDLNGPLVL